MSEQVDLPLSQLDLRNHMARTATTAAYPFAGTGNLQGLMYVGLGLAGEAGEIANQIKKIARDDGGFLTSERFHKIKDELGDVLWYVLRLCYEMHLDPYAVLAYNQAKLAQRAADGQITGDRRNGSLHRVMEKEWEADLAEAAGKQDVYAVPVEGLRALIYNGVETENSDGIHGKVVAYTVRCRSLRCPDWLERDGIEKGYQDLHEKGLAHIMAEHTPWGRAGRE